MNNNTFMKFRIPIALLLISLCHFISSCSQAEQENPVSRVEIDPSAIEVLIGESFQLKAILSPSNSTGPSVIWASSAESVATVSNTGLVTGIAEGSSVITATAGGKTGICTVTVKNNRARSVTIGAEKVTAISAVLEGKANIGSTSSSGLMVGFQYSTSSGILPSNSVTVEAKDADSDYNYSANITGLEPEVTYYFRSLVRENGIDYYGETKEFTTKELTTLISTNEATDISLTGANLNAYLNLKDVQHSTKSFGFYWGLEEDTLVYTINASENEHSISAELTGLNPATQYWYKAYIEVDNRAYYGEVLSFTTGMIPVESITLNKNEYLFKTIGDTYSLKATILPSDATDRRIVWSSSDQNVVSIDDKGMIKALDNGTSTITVTTIDQNKTATCFVTVSQQVTSISLTESSVKLAEGEEKQLMVSVYPDNAANKTLKWTSSDNAIATVDNNGKIKANRSGHTTIKAIANDGGGVYAECKVQVFITPEAIDLGIVVNGKSIKWASFNIGATKPEEYGDYYAWGETDTKSCYNWNTYKFGGGPTTAYPFSKYNINSSLGPVDNKKELEPEDDVAHVVLGGKWRMPTDAEWTALRTQCTWTRTKRNGVKGRLITAENGNSIFLPDAGFMEDNRLSDDSSEMCSSGRYWSSSLSMNYSNRAYFVFFWTDDFFPDDVSDVVRRDIERYLGHSIRPVTE